MDELNGILLVDKPEGPTSHDLVDAIRRTFGLAKVGHAGTLDPAASGLLIMLIGHSTKSSRYFTEQDKTYEGTLTLGLETDTGDREGRVRRQVCLEPIPLATLQEVFRSFEGEQEQVPPMFSAVKVHGRRLYQLARKGLTVSRPARQIQIKTFEIRRLQFPEVDFFLRCSKGTYVRSLVEEIGKALRCPATLLRLRRLCSGTFRIEEAIPLQKLLATKKSDLATMLLPSTKASLGDATLSPIC